MNENKSLCKTCEVCCPDGLKNQNTKMPLCSAYAGKLSIEWRELIGLDPCSHCGHGDKIRATFENGRRSYFCMTCGAPVEAEFEIRTGLAEEIGRQILQELLDEYNKNTGSEYEMETFVTDIYGKHWKHIQLQAADILEDYKVRLNQEPD